MNEFLTSTYMVVCLHVEASGDVGGRSLLDMVPGSFGYGVFIEARVGWNVVEV